MESEQQAFNELGPDRILDAVESAGHLCDGRLLALNSYENRVYQVGLDDGGPVIAKFYRPGRWSDAAILEEHQFTQTLAEEEIPAVPPLRQGAQSLFHHGPYRFALYPRRGGRAPDLENPDQLQQLGRTFGRIHAVGAAKVFQYRPRLDIDSFGVRPYRFVCESGFLPPELAVPYRSLAEDLIEGIRQRFRDAGNFTILRLHGDAHGGNILWTDDGPHMVDFDDARNGPAIQDLWMFLSGGDRSAMTQQLTDLLDGYTQFHTFNARELHLVEALRTLRMIHYAAWLAERWADPAFPRAFPWFNSPRYWEEHILALREQAAMLNEPPLPWD